MPKTRLMVLDPTWQHFSSMYREAAVAEDARTGMEISHHRTASLYFGVAAIECFLNREMTRFLRGQNIDDDAIFERMRKPKFREKLTRWPREITGDDLKLSRGAINRLMTAYDLRSDLTHLKNFWTEAFDSLEQLVPLGFVDLVAEYIIAFHVAKSERFPYWLYGWNYLSPVPEGYQIAVMPPTQFSHSLRYLGFVSAHGAGASYALREAEMLGDLSSYKKVSSFLRAAARCEPKIDRFPHQPKLCARWWETGHQSSCGTATPEALQRAIDLDDAYASKRFPTRSKTAPPSGPLRTDETPTGPRSSALGWKFWLPSLARWRVKWAGRR